MFYSQCLLSRKGPLKAIWVAAYCHKKLKKDQIAETDISSSVDEIVLNEVTVTYRVLGYLLLGVVRIYSKKVEFLYNDCQEVLININTYALSRKDRRRDESMCAPYVSITLPDKFELDTFDFEIVEDVSRGNMGTHQKITLEERWEDGGSHSFMNKEHHDGSAFFPTNICAPMEEIPDVFSPYLMGVDTVESPIHSSRDLEESIEKLQDNHLPQEQIDLEMFHESGDPHVNDSQFNEVSNHEEQIKLSKITPPSPDEQHDFSGGSPVRSSRDLEASIEKLQANHLPQEPLDLEMFHESADPHVNDLQFNEVYNHEEQIKRLKITPPSPDEQHALSGESPRASTGDRTPNDSKIPHDSAAHTPEFMVIPTPARKEQRRNSRKRKCVFDETIVLSNEVVRQSLHDSSSLVCKRRKAPHTTLDAWLASTIPTLSLDFSKPLIPYSSRLKTLFYEKDIQCQEQVIAEGPLKLGKRGLETLSKDSEQEINEENSVDQSGSVKLGKCTTTSEPDIVEHVPAVAGTVDKRSAVGQSGSSGLIKCTAASEPDIVEHVSAVAGTIEKSSAIGQSESSGLIKCTTASNKADKIEPIASGASTVEKEKKSPEVPDTELNLIDEEASLHEEDGNQDGWSTRTRTVARYLCKMFLSKKERRESEVLSLASALEGRTRKESARLFYEVLVLKSRDVIDVKQETPYSDIIALATPRTEALLLN